MVDDNNSNRITGNGCIKSIDTPVETRESMDRIQRDASILKLKCKLEELQINLVKDMGTKIGCMMDEVIKDLRNGDAHNREFKGFVTEQYSEVWKNRDKAAIKGKGKILGEKVFAARDSLFTCLYQVPHMKTIYHAFCVMLIVMIMNTAIQDYVTKGIINVGQHTINAGMRGFWRGVGMWTLMQATVFLVYYALKMWADVRAATIIRKNESFRQLWDSVCLSLFVFFQLFFLYAVSYAVVRIDLAFVSGVSVLLEMTRMIMKMHAFVRTNVPRILEGKLKVDSAEPTGEEPVTYPTVSQFTYYMFAPTFIYRDNYLRTSKINWTFALSRLLEVIGVMFFMANIHERYIYPYFHDFGKAQITTEDLVIKLFGMILPGFLIFLSGFYCILHAWLNFTGELLRFSDRMYYKDWWTSANFDAYYRNWNVVVHDWLYEFIYKDMFHYVFRGSKTISGLMVFYVSAIIHEYILMVALRFFLPIMLSFFGVFGVLVVFLTRNFNKTAGNVFLWFALSMGNGLMISLYAMEWYARLNCNISNDSWSSYFVPAILSCNGLK